MSEKLLIKNSRFTTEVEYSEKDVNETIDLALSDGVDLLVIDSNLPSNLQDYFLSTDSVKNIIKIPGGEDAKTLGSVTSLLEKVEDLGLLTLNRVLAVGGGTIQDLVGTACALLKRGVFWDFLPTTVLAQCDSCIGSKTSINGKSTKNSYGLFWAPRKIFIQEEFIASLPHKDIISGIGDALHYLFTDINEYRDVIDEYLDKLERYNTQGYRVLDIGRLARICHGVKKAYIEADEFDQGIRKHLNLGHTFGHAIESLSNLTIPHGVAVMHGILIAQSYSSEKYGVDDDILFRRLSEYLDKSREFSRRKIASMIYSELGRYIDLLSKDKKSGPDTVGIIVFDNDFQLRKVSVGLDDIKEYFLSPKTQQRLLKVL